MPAAIICPAGFESIPSEKIIMPAGLFAPGSCLKGDWKIPNCASATLKMSEYNMGILKL